jgi:hypothetical protein
MALFNTLIVVQDREVSLLLGDLVKRLKTSAAAEAANNHSSRFFTLQYS